MLLRISTGRKKNLKRTGLSSWRALGRKSRFVFNPRLLKFLRPKASYLVLEIKDADRVVCPKIYLDHGEEFYTGTKIELGRTHDSITEIELGQTRNSIYVIPLKADRLVQRVEFRPSTYPANFSLRAFGGFSENAVRAFVEHKIRDAANHARELPTCEIIAPGRPWELKGVGFPAPVTGDVAQHFERVIAMASQRYEHANAWAGTTPCISFVSPMFNTPPHYLDQLLDSFRIQRLGAWELILCDMGSTSPETTEWLEDQEDGPSLRIIKCPTNLGIEAATNQGFSVAKGSWVGLIDHVDALVPYAVDALLEVIRDNPAARFIYTDEVMTDGRLKPQKYVLKPAYDPVLLSGMNYINHLSLFRRDRLIEFGGLRSGYQESRNFDLLLRYLSRLRADEIFHLPYPAYLWRQEGASYSVRDLENSTRNARRALSEIYARDGNPARVESVLDTQFHRVFFDARAPSWPKVSIVIPNRDSYPLISRILNDLVHHTDYPDMEIVIVDNGSRDPAVLHLYERIKKRHPDFRTDIVQESFNFSRQVNRGIRLAQGEHILLLNNDIEVIDRGWLKEMVSCLAYAGTGIVGARLLYPNDTLQHVGVIISSGAAASGSGDAYAARPRHWFIGMEGNSPGPMGRLKVRQSFSAVTGACMLITRSCLEAVGSFDETDFPVSHNDIDYCMRAGRCGFRVVWTPFATLYHHEAVSRGSDQAPENIVRANREAEKFIKKNVPRDYVDPAVNPWTAVSQWDIVHGQRMSRMSILTSLPSARSTHV
ncbi:MAG: glycosyltransferase [Acetobacteraceae bacterium]|nr:glycosyltransferase [Acetobacteraceae bacterium]